MSTLSKIVNDTIAKHEHIEILLSIATEKEIIKAERKQAELYNKYNSVRIIPMGLCKIKIIASN